MRIVQVASLVHKWLALIVGAQILLWVVSGLFFTLFPIEQVRSEHRIRRLPPTELTQQDFDHVQELAGAIGASKVTLEARPEGAVVVAEFSEGPPRLFDARSGAQLSPLGADEAKQIETILETITMQTDAQIILALISFC